MKRVRVKKLSQRHSPPDRVARSPKTRRTPTDIQQTHIVRQDRRG